ncbi:Pentatricopeptide repeat [Quillaja saponaria]|uniref:Pentatricopeptide repeat n=1 Tax=Quillaja saponaria TaxID=32244 RepID=A0AAD7M612_QUISA|nr:Pentatricopeptide repeat [Quillaja saponaria]
MRFEASSRNTPKYGAPMLMELRKRDISQIFDSIFCRQQKFYQNSRTCGNESLLSSSFEDLLTSMGEQCHLSAQDCLSRKKYFDEGRKPESISLSKISLLGLTSEDIYSKHVTIIRGLCLEVKLGAALSLRWKMMQKGVVPDVFTHNHLVNGLCKSGDMEMAALLIKEMLEMGSLPNLVTYNTFIKGYCLIDKVDKALGLFSMMANSAIMPNKVTCNILVHSLCRRGILEEAIMFLEEVLNDNDKESPDLITSTIFMDGYFKNGDMV